MTEPEMQLAYLNLVRDADFDKLELALNEPNIFSILSIEHMEIRHSNFLGWLLNPKENHGLNDLFLKRFLREIFSDEKVKGVKPLDAERLNFQKVEIIREWKSIDLLLKFPNLVICIENKVHSKDHSSQLSRYKKIVEEEFPESEFKRVLVYLTPYGDESSEEQDAYAFFSYQIIIDILDRILEVYKNLIPTQSTIYIKDYIKSLKRNLMATDTTNDIAKEIYRNHQKLLDFIFENKPDYLDDFSKILEGFVIDKGYLLGSKNKAFVKFLPPALKEIVPNYKMPNGWPEKEAFLFEFEFRNKTKLNFKAIVSPAKPNSDIYKNKLSRILKEVKSARKTTEIWEVFFIKTITLDIEELIKVDPKVIFQEIEKFWTSQVEPVITAVETAMLAHKNELIALKQQVEN